MVRETPHGNALPFAPTHRHRFQCQHGRLLHGGGLGDAPGTVPESGKRKNGQLGQAGDHSN